MSSSNSNGKSLVNGKRNASLDRHRRQDSLDYKDVHGGGGMMIEKLDHVQTRSSGGGSASMGTVHRGDAQTQSGAATMPPVAPPPIERLLPSPPLTPVASVSSLRKAASKEKAKGKRVGAELDLELSVNNNIVHKVAKTVERTGRVASSEYRSERDQDQEQRTDGENGVSPGVGSVVRDATEDGDGVDTEVEGALSSSTWSLHPDGVTEVSTTLIPHSHSRSHTPIQRTGAEIKADADNGADNDDDNKDTDVDMDKDGRSSVAATVSTTAVITASAQPSAAPESDIPHGLSSPLPPLRLPQEGVEEVRDPLRRNSGDISGSEAPDSVTTGLADLDKSTPGASSLVSASVPPGSGSGHKASTTSTAMPHPLYNGPSPQPWDLVDPPPNNNAQLELEERLRRIRKDSTRSAAVPGEVLDVVVKDGKRYRIPHSTYYFGPPPDTSAFGTDPVGQIGVHHPREIVRVERDYLGGELIQFSPCYPLELEGRITPTKFLESINAINETLLEAHSLRWSFLDNALAVLTLYISRLFVTSHYDRKMQRLKEIIEGLNKEVYNPAGLNILWPKDVAFMFLEIEYY